MDRDADESARKLVFIPFMQGQPVQAKTIVLDKAKEMLEALENTPNALGYSTIGLLNSAQSQEIQILKLDGVMPSASALTQGNYPWHLTLGVIHRQDAPPAIQEFVKFVKGAEGQQLLQESGYAAVEV